jgi:hypothetical protein
MFIVDCQKETDKDPISLYFLKKSNDFGVSALGMALFGVEIVEHWSSLSFRLRLQYFF